MSLFGALDTAISGLTSQSAAFGNISDNIANSQTVGFKRVDTSFQDYLTTSTATATSPAPWSRPRNTSTPCRARSSQTDNPLALAISGQGFFAVSQAEEQTDHRAGVLAAAVLHPRRRLPAGQERLSGQLAPATTSTAGRSHPGRHGRQQHAGADPGERDAVQSGRHRQRHALRQSARPRGSTDPPTGDEVPITSNVSVYDAQGTVAPAHAELPLAGAGTNDWTVDRHRRHAVRPIGTGTRSTYAAPTARSASVTQGATDHVHGRRAGDADADHQYRTTSGMQTIDLNLGTYRRDQRRHAVCRRQLQPARPQPGRRAARQLLRHHHDHRRRRRRELRQRPVAHDRPGADRHVQRPRRAAAAERSGVHRDRRLRRAARRRRPAPTARARW